MPSRSPGIRFDIASAIGRAAKAELECPILELYERLDVLVNVASAASPRSPVADIDWAGYLETSSFNVAASMNLRSRAAEKMALHSDGSIIDIGALSSTLLPKLSRYTSSKAAMVVMSKTMAQEVGPSGVRVNIVTPGFTTGAALDSMFEQMAERGGGDAEDLKQRAAKQAALHRHVDPEDIAEAVLFLASGRGRNVTGAVYWGWLVCF